MSNRPTPTLRQRRSQWSAQLREAQWWIAEARKQSKRGDYSKSRDSTMMACFLLDNACQIETEDAA